MLVLKAGMTSKIWRPDFADFAPTMVGEGVEVAMVYYYPVSVALVGALHPSDHRDEMLSVSKVEYQGERHCYSSRVQVGDRNCRV